MYTQPMTISASEAQKIKVPKTIRVECVSKRNYLNVEDFLNTVVVDDHAANNEIDESQCKGLNVCVNL